MACRKPTRASQHAIAEIVAPDPVLRLAMDATRPSLAAPIYADATRRGICKRGEIIERLAILLNFHRSLPITMGICSWKGARDLKVWGENWSIV